MTLKVLLILICIFLSFAPTRCYSQQPKSTEQKPPENDAYTWDFGRAKRGEILKHAFILKNDSENALQIKDITTSCGCTASQVKKKMLLPSETTIIEVRFNSKGYSGAAQQFVYVHTDSLDKPIIRYIIKADITK